MHLEGSLGSVFWKAVLEVRTKAISRHTLSLVSPINTWAIVEVTPAPFTDTMAAVCWRCWVVCVISSHMLKPLDVSILYARGVSSKEIHDEVRR
jgi:hypothetical protein